MLSTRNQGRLLWKRYHIFRQMARENEFTSTVFSDSDREQFDLDEENAESYTSPAKITGEDTKDAYIEEPYGDRLDVYNSRETNPRRM